MLSPIQIPSAFPPFSDFAYNAHHHSGPSREHLLWYAGPSPTPTHLIPQGAETLFQRPDHLKLAKHHLKPSNLASNLLFLLRSPTVHPTWLPYPSQEVLKLSCLTGCLFLTFDLHSGGLSSLQAHAAAGPATSSMQR